MRPFDSSISVEPYIFDPRPDYPFLLTVKRYFRSSRDGPSEESGLTVLFTHGTGFTKESWESTAQSLLADKSLNVYEAWALDAPNHGDAAILNEEFLQKGYVPIFRWEEYARSIHLFLAGLGTGVDVDFRKRRIVGVGHSMGAVSYILSSTYYPRIQYTTIILVEPMLYGDEWLTEGPHFLESGAKGRRDIWPSFENALQALSGRSSFKTWDQAQLKRYVYDGMRALPTLTYPDKQGVTLKCTRIQEAATYRDTLALHKAYNYLPTFLQRYPVHIVYGAIDDYISAEQKDDLLYKGSGGSERFAGIWRVPDAGHLCVQVNPSGTTQVVSDVLQQVAAVSDKPRTASDGVVQCKL